MKILKLSSKYCIILFVFNFFWQISSANEPVDIWKIKKLDNSNDTKEENSININSEIIQGVKIEQQNENIIVNQELDAANIKLAGLYDPAENGLSIDMWSNSDGNEIRTY